MELVRWNVSEGEIVETGTELCELVSDKVAFQMEAPFKGRIDRIEKEAGSIVKTGDALLFISPYTLAKE